MPGVRHLFIALLLICLGCLAAVSPPAFAQKSAEKPAASAADIALGKSVYDQRCAHCHFSDSTAQKIGPGLKGLFTRMEFANGKKVDDAAVARWIDSGGKDMPGFKDVLKPDQVRPLIAYMKTL